MRLSYLQNEDTHQNDCDWSKISHLAVIDPPLEEPVFAEGDVANFKTGAMTHMTYKSESWFLIAICGRRSWNICNLERSGGGGREREGTGRMGAGVGRDGLKNMLQRTVSQPDKAQLLVATCGDRNWNICSFARRGGRHAESTLSRPDGCGL